MVVQVPDGRRPAHAWSKEFCPSRECGRGVRKDGPDTDPEIARHEGSIDGHRGAMPGLSEVHTRRVAIVDDDTPEHPE